jgi:quercetin dioxygenase-like cupin family protein
MRRTTIALAAFCALGWAGHAAAQPAQPAAATVTPQITCAVVLAPAAIPGDASHYFSIEKITVAPGHDAFMHEHDAVEYFQVVSGTGRLSIAGKPDVALSPGVVVPIPPHVQHQQHNGSASEPLVYMSSFVGPMGDPKLTQYDAGPDKLSGCPHKLAKPF